MGRASPICGRIRRPIGKWFGADLNADNRLMMYVPRGFAHAILTLADNTEALYLVSDFYAPQAERGVRFDDPGSTSTGRSHRRRSRPRIANWPDFDPAFHGVDGVAGVPMKALLDRREFVHRLVVRPGAGGARGDR